MDAVRLITGTPYLQVIRGNSVVMLEVSSISTNADFACAPPRALPFDQIANVCFSTLGIGTDKREIDNYMLRVEGGDVGTSTFFFIDIPYMHVCGLLQISRSSRVGPLAWSYPRVSFFEILLCL